jgi:tetrahydromethanopterin S-methyltransferase subunit E
MNNKLLYAAIGGAVGYLFLSKMVPTKLLAGAAGAALAYSFAPPATAG